MQLIVLFVEDMQLGDLLPKVRIKCKLLKFIQSKIQNMHLCIQILCANY
jgi:hypothetical protein